jgi:hypothetical protein
MSTVKYYNCQVRLGGWLLHTVPKSRISGEEVRILKHLHGDDSIVELREVGVATAETREEVLNALADTYSSDPEKHDGRKLVEKVFGVTLSDFDSWLMEREIAEETRQDEQRALQAMNQQATAPLPKFVAPS